MNISKIGNLAREESSRNQTRKLEMGADEVQRFNNFAGKTLFISSKSFCGRRVSRDINIRVTNSI